ncbi:MAG: hypothetical protein JSW58_09465, partial [Candidatus Latescibacterota bacterium]
LSLGETAQSHREKDSSLVDLGNLIDWEDALRDRVPIVIRAPDAALSRSYNVVSESLLFKINQFRRKAGAPRVSGISAGIRSR